MYPETRAEALDVFGVLCDPVCVQVLGVVSASPSASLEIASRLPRLKGNRVEGALTKLAAAHLTALGDDGTWRADLDVLRRSRRRLAYPEWVISFIEVEPKLEGFLNQDGIEQYPADKHLLRTLGRLIRDEISQSAREFGERELTSRLAAFGTDGAELRRLLVDLELMERAPATGTYYVYEPNGEAN